jgi:hypothetical protein
MWETVWQFAGHAAAVRLKQFHAAVDLARPGDGLTEVSVAGQRIAGARMLGIAAPMIAATDRPRPSESYVRGPDLAVAYEESGQWPVRVDAVWRATAPTTSDNFLTAVHLIVSVRTPLLESRPELLVQSTVPSGEMFRLLSSAAWTPLAAPKTIAPPDGAGCLLFRMPDSDLTYVEMVHPADFQHDELGRDASDGGTLRIAHRLFRTNLEKGVILRARVRGVFFARRGDMAAAAKCYAAFAAADPPLGT